MTWPAFGVIGGEFIASSVKFFRRSQRRVPSTGLPKLNKGIATQGWSIIIIISGLTSRPDLYHQPPDRPPNLLPMYSSCPGVHNIHPNHYLGVRLRAVAFGMFVVIWQALLSIPRGRYTDQWEGRVFLPFLRCFGNWVGIRSFILSTLTSYFILIPVNPWTTKAVLWHWKLRGLSWRIPTKYTKFGWGVYSRHWNCWW